MSSREREQRDPFEFGRRLNTFSNNVIRGLHAARKTRAPVSSTEHASLSIHNDSTWSFEVDRRTYPLLVATPSYLLGLYVILHMPGALPDHLRNLPNHKKIEGSLLIDMRISKYVEENRKDLERKFTHDMDKVERELMHIGRSRTSKSHVKRG